MSEKLFRLKSPLISNGLISALRNPESVSVEAVNCTVDLTNLSTLIELGFLKADIRPLLIRGDFNLKSFSLMQPPLFQG